MKASVLIASFVVACLWGGAFNNVCDIGHTESRGYFKTKSLMNFI